MTCNPSSIDSPHPLHIVVVIVLPAVSVLVSSNISLGISKKLRRKAIWVGNRGRDVGVVDCVDYMFFKNKTILKKRRRTFTCTQEPLRTGVT